MTKQEKNIQETLETTQKETFEFLKTRYDWVKFNNTPAVCIGVLDAVFQMVLELSPNHKKGIELITYKLDQLKEN